jgi:hypothetical protein
MPDESTTDGSSDQFIITVTVPKGAKPEKDLHPGIADAVTGPLKDFFKSKGLEDTASSLGVECCGQSNKGKAEVPR